MAEGRAKENWQHTSALMALIANAHRDPKKGKAFEPDDFNPYSEKTSGSRQVGMIVVTKENVSLLKQAFTGDKL